MDRFVVGFVRGSHGLAGNVKFESASGEYAHFARLGEVTLRDNETETTYAVERVDISASFPTMKLAGIDSLEAAKKLNGRAIVAPRGSACPLREGEWYVEDLKQCVLVHEAPDGTRVRAGVITGVLEGGADELLEVECAQEFSSAAETAKNGAPKTCLVPFNKEFIGEVDIARKTIELKHLWILE